jgi:hypothetical protein
MSKCMLAGLHGNCVVRYTRNGQLVYQTECALLHWLQGMRTEFRLMIPASGPITTYCFSHSDR